MINRANFYHSAQQKLAFGVRQYSVSSKRAPLPTVTSSSRQQQQQQQQRGGGAAAALTPGLCPTLTAPVSQSKVPKFTMARTEFMTADLFARHRQLVETPHGSSMDAGSRPRASYKTLSELGMCKGMGLEEANIPVSKLKQIYAAPASVYMRVTPDALIPEAMRLGPLAEPLLGEDPFSNGFGALRLDGEEDVADFVDEFFDAILARPAESWSARRERQEARMARQARWMAHEMVDPVDGINGDGASGSPSYQLTSVRRKRVSKMNKHKHKKLRKRTRALRKRLGK
ncbi:hypothetical protein GGF44_005804 [Coemansia sp. RSA 1694]|nr:hypothetical protein GGF44_005804 [Coemansia sp. RSA 1694]